MGSERATLIDRDEAIDSAFRAHAADLYRLVFSIVRDQGIAEELTQETFARAYDRFAGFDRTRPIGGWLHGIATHLAVDHLRRRNIRIRFGLRDPRLIALDAPVVPDYAAALAEREAVSALLDDLPVRARAMLVLRHGYGYDDRSIAEFLGTSPGNVRTQISRAHQHLRAKLRSGIDRDEWSDPTTRAATKGRVPDGHQ